MLVFNQSIASSLARSYSAIVSMNTTRPATMMNRFSNDSGYSQKSSIPSGYTYPVMIASPISGGELVSSRYINGSGSITANLLKGINLEADLTGISIVTDAALTLITSLAATIDGAGTLTANLTGSVNLAANLVGSGELDAGLSLIANLAANLLGEASISAELKGIAHLSADIFVNQSDATVQQIVDGIWNALMSDYNNAGSMGEFLKKLLTTNKFIGLK